MHELIVDVQPDRVVIEAGSAARWVKDVYEALEIDVAVANPNHAAWRWKSVKRKTDKDDALTQASIASLHKLARPLEQLDADELWRGAAARSNRAR